MIPAMGAVTVWTSEKVFHSGQDFFNALLAELDSATKTIDIETYIFDDDPLGRLVVQRLCQLAQRGVAVRLMVDGVGASGFFSRFGMELAQKGVSVRVYNPPPWHWALYSFRFFPGLGRFFQFVWSANRRNHRKSFIIDQKAVYTGGINVSAKEVEEYYGAQAWRDTGIRIEGRETTVLLKAFEEAWEQAWTPVSEKQTLEAYWQRYRRARSTKALKLVQVNYTRGLRKRSHRDFIRMIMGARERLWITTAYFVPEAATMRAIRAVAQRGVDVRIIVPRYSDVVFTPWVGAAFYFSLLRSGVRIFEYLPRMMHAKCMVVDDWGMVGTANINHRSVFHDLEANVLVTTEAGVESLTEQFLIDQGESRAVSQEDWIERPIWQRFVGTVLLMVKYYF